MKRRSRFGPLAAASLLFSMLLAPSCTFLPAEFNCSPIYRHRLDEKGDLLELDVIWPVIHYERTAAGGDDFRIRPLYRRVTEPETDIVGMSATEHQYLWPLGRIRHDARQTRNRLFPLFWYTERQNDLGLQETDWYFLFPFFWGGSREDGQEGYFAFFPLYGSIPDFLTYERFSFFLWPLFTQTRRPGSVGTLLLWPLIGWGHDAKGMHWHRFLPLWSFSSSPEFWRFYLLWPLISWGSNNLDSEVPVHHFLFWPLFGRIWGRGVSGLTLLLPLYERLIIEGRYKKYSIFWPFLRFEEDIGEHTRMSQWWMWPLVARTLTDDQSAWSFLWPFFWSGRYQDPDADRSTDRFVPFYQRERTRGLNGTEAENLNVWPLVHRYWEAEHGRQTEAAWWMPALWPWSTGNAYSVREHYGWLWTIAEGRRHGPDDVSMSLIANLYTVRTRAARRSQSMPFLFSYDADAEDGTFWLFNILPIPVGGRSPAKGDAR